MKPPTRLLDDPELSAELRADLQSVMRHPHEVDLQRATRALAAALGTSAISATGHASSSASPAAGSGGPLSALPLALKATLAAIGGAALVGLVGLAAVQLQPSAREAPATRPAASAPPRQTIPRQPSAAAPAAPQPEPQPAAARPPAPPAPSASRREIAQLRRIQRLLAYDPAAAQRVAEASQREFPQGVLREERMGLSVLALFKLGDRARAREEAQRFLDQHPQSPLAERIRVQAEAELGP